MGEYILEGKNESEYRALDSFTQGYIEAMFFTEHSERYDSEEWNTPLAQRAMERGSCGGSIPCDASFTDLAPEALAKIISDCARFQEANRADLDEAIDTFYDKDETRAGYDFWYTRNGHGCGFWDGNLSEELGRKLTDACDSFGDVDCYFGDDGKVYLT